MSNSTLQTLERRWRESGAIQDEARYLVERVRTGELPQINLRLAAMCGCPPAVEAMGPGPTETTVKDWLASFQQTADTWFPEMVLRAAHAACWVSTLVSLARVQNPWMPGEIGRVFQLTAYRILGGTEPDPADVITPIEQEHIETMEAVEGIFGKPGQEMAAALQSLRQASALYASRQQRSGATYTLLWAESQIGVDGIYHALSFLVAPYLLYGEDAVIWWREEVRFLYRGLNLHVKNNPWWMDAS